MINMPEIGKRISAQRKMLKLTQESLSEKVNCSPHYISEIENGRKQPSADLLISLAVNLNMSLDYMILGTTPLNGCSASLLNLIEMCSDSDRRRIELFAQSLIEYNQSEDA